MAALLTLACSASTAVSGRLSAASPSGRTGPQADVEVILLRATEAFESHWSWLVAAFASERALAVLAAEEAETARGRASADRSAASAAWLSVLLQREDVDWGAYDRAAERQTAAVERLLRAGHRRREAQSRLAEIARRYRQDAWDLVQSSQAYRTRTDQEGRFAFAGVTPGRYIVTSRVQFDDRAIYWFIRVNLQPHGPLAADLTPANAGWPFS